MESKFLKAARAAREEKNTEDAKKYYDMVRTEDPDDGEAKFFYQYYALYEGKNGEIASRFNNLCNVIEPSLKLIASTDSSDGGPEKANAEDRLKIVKEIVDTFTPETWALNRYMNHLTVGSGSNTQRVLSNSDINFVCRMGVASLYNLGDCVVKYFGAISGAMNVAIIPWKEAVTLHQKWYGIGLDKTLPETYAEKIKKVDPSYEMPKKGGCIQLADKK